MPQDAVLTVKIANTTTKTMNLADDRKWRKLGCKSRLCHEHNRMFIVAKTEEAQTLRIYFAFKGRVCSDNAESVHFERY
jgi:hypothetical protein